MQDNQRSTNFRYVYSNGSKITLVENELSIIFGIQEDRGQSDQLLEEVGIIMTPSAAKALTLKLQRVIQQTEAETGALIPAEPSRYADLENAIRLAVESQEEVKSGTNSVVPR